MPRSGCVVNWDIERKIIRPAALIAVLRKLPNNVWLNAHWQPDRGWLDMRDEEGKELGFVDFWDEDLILWDEPLSIPDES